MVSKLDLQRCKKLKELKEKLESLKDQESRTDAKYKSAKEHLERAIKQIADAINDYDSPF